MSSMGSVVLDPERISSFKTSLVSLKKAMKQRQQTRKSGVAPSSFSRTNAVTSSCSSGEDLDPLSPLSSSSISQTPMHPKSLAGWIRSEREVLLWVVACALLGALLGFSVGAGWLTRGSGTYRPTPGRVPRVLGAMSAKAGRHAGRRNLRRHFVVSAWRSNLAGRVRGTAAYRLLAPWGGWGGVWGILDLLRGVLLSQRTLPHQHWIAGSPLWPPNWILFREVDLSLIDVGESGLSPAVAQALSFVLPWRRSLIRALASGPRGAGVGPLERDGSPVGPASTRSSSSSSSSPFSPSVLSSTPSAQPVNPYYHPMAFHALREYVIRFDGGYVHPDLGFLVPAPSGAERGLGMVRDTYNKCQVHCNPGTAEEMLKEKWELQARLEQSKKQEIVDQELMEEMMKEFPEMELASSMTASNPSSSASGNPTDLTPQQQSQHVDGNTDPIRNTTTYEGVQAAVQLQSTSTSPPYSQSEILLRIPLEAQITRKTALEALKGLLLPEQSGRSTSLEELDDAPLLALYLAHERGLGAGSRIWPYVATLPPRPTCALHWGWRQSVVDAVTAAAAGMGTDVQGWPNEIGKAAEMSERIVATLSRSWSDTLATRQGADDVTENVRWALCQVASRAVAGREGHGRLRLVPVMDMINHDEAAGNFVELLGKERMEDGHLLDADENQAGTFIVRSERHGVRKWLGAGKELMANYNVPAYSPLDWFLNMGYIPPERAGKWTMLEAGLPRSYRGGFSRKSNSGPAKDSGAFGSGKPEIQVIRQHTQQQSCSR